MKTKKPASMLRSLAEGGALVLGATVAMAVSMGCQHKGSSTVTPASDIGIIPAIAGTALGTAYTDDRRQIGYPLYSIGVLYRNPKIKVLWAYPSGTETAASFAGKRLAEVDVAFVYDGRYYIGEPGWRQVCEQLDSLRKGTVLAIAPIPGRDCTFDKHVSFMPFVRPEGIWTIRELNEKLRSLRFAKDGEAFIYIVALSLTDAND
jgi:hypothetical protein